MLEHFLCLMVQVLELGLAGSHHSLLGFEVLTRVFKFVASALVLALLLVELQLALLLFCFYALCFRDFL